MGGFGFGPPVAVPDHGVWDGAGLGTAFAGRPGVRRRPERPLVGVVFYRAHLIAGNTRFVADLCEALERGRRRRPRRLLLLAAARRRGPGPRPRPVRRRRGGQRWSPPCWPWAASQPAPARWAAPGDWRAATGRWGSWPPSTSPWCRRRHPACRRRRGWRRPPGCRPIDVGMGVAACELDGRITAPPFAFRELVDDGDELGAPAHAYRTVGDRAGRVAGIAVRLARLRRLAAEGRPRRVAIVLSAYPTRRSRLGNAVGLDTPASALRLLAALRAAGCRVDRIPADGDQLMAELADGFVYDADRVIPAEAATAVGRLDRSRLRGVVRFAARSGPAAGRGAVGAGAGHGPAPRRPTDLRRPRPGRRRSSPSSHLGATATTRSPSTTRPPCPPRTTTWPSTDGSTRAGAPTPSSTWASTARWSGCRARASACRPPASPMPPWATCRSSTRSWSTTPARAPRPSGAPMR